MTSSLCIAVPAWGAAYVDLAVKYTIPACLASLEGAGFEDVTWFIHTDTVSRPRFQEALDGQRVQFFPLRTPPGRDGFWFAFKAAHKEAIEHTPKGGIVALLNSDIVVSKETFRVVWESFENEAIKTVVSVGIRTAVDHAKPPIGASAEELARWIWDNPHHITKECIWGSGKSQHPTILFFEDDDGVAMHGYHLTPMFVRKDRNLNFNGTIDDDMLGNYQDHEIRYLTEGEAIFAELSPDWKKHPFGRPLTVDGVLDFGKRRFRPAHVRNFRQRMKVLGNPTKNHPAVDEILARLPK